MVYFVSDGTYTKIGKSKTPLNRIKDLQTSNPNALTFKYIFDCGDHFEKRLHKTFNNYRTNSNNEWFDLRNINVETILKSFKEPIIKDVCRAEHKAGLLNNEFYRGNVYDHERRSVIVDNLYRNKKRDLKDKRSALIEEVKYHLEYYKNKILSYDKFVIKYGFTKNEISFFMRSCSLSKQIFEHNKKVYGD